MQCKLRSLKQVEWSAPWKRNWKKLTCNVPCVRFSQRRANRWWQGLQHEKLCPAGCVTIAGTQFAFIWSWVDRIFAVCCLQRLPELLPRDENATPPIPENRAHGLAGLSGKRMDRNLSLWCSFQTTLDKKYVKRGKKGKQKRNSLVLWSGSTAALATRNRATVQSPLFGKKWDFYESLLSKKHKPPEHLGPDQDEGYCWTNSSVQACHAPPARDGPTTYSRLHEITPVLRANCS